MGEEKMNDVTKQEQSVEEGKNSQLAQAGGDVTQNQKNYFFVGDDERAVGAFSLDRAIGLKKSELLDAKRYFVYPEGRFPGRQAFHFSNWRRMPWKILYRQIFELFAYRGQQ